jgi:peptide chain release factor subunit 1
MADDASRAVTVSDPVRGTGSREAPVRVRIAGSTRAIPAVLQALRETAAPAGGVLSAYIDTSPERSIGQAYLIAYRDRVKAFRATLPKAKRVHFDTAAAQAEAVLTRSVAPGHPGLAVFASGDEAYVFAVPLPKRPPETVRFGEQPVVMLLEAAVDDGERAAVLLFDKERARLFTIVLGEIEERHSLFDEVPGKQKTGDWFALSQTRYARHHEDHVLRHAKRTIAALLDELERHPFDRLLLTGPDEAIALLEDHLPRRLRLRVAGRLALELFASDADVLTAAGAALEEIEREQEAEAIRNLLNDAGSPRVTLGPDDTLPALGDGRVHQLFILNSYLGAMRECPACGRLTRREDPCTRCGAATRTVPDLRERAIAAAIDSGARVECVSLETTDLVALHGGIGARTRWA